MNLDEKIESLETLNKFLNSQLSTLDDRVKTLELALIKDHLSREEIEVKTRSKLDYLLREIQKLRDKDD